MIDTENFFTFDQLLKEATSTVEKELSIEDEGWSKLGGTGGSVIADIKRIDYVKQSRVYHLLDPLGTQSIRLWTDYTFGNGISWSSEDTKAQAALEAFWFSRANQAVLSTKGQRKSSNKLLVDGEIFFALFLGPKGQPPIVRRIDPLEITEIITNPDDVEEELYFKRDWTDRQNKRQVAYYRSFNNIKDVGAKDSLGKTIKKTEDALVYHLAWGDETRGVPLLLPALDWIKQYRRFLASRVAIVLAMAKFAWKSKIAGGSAAVASVKSVLNDKAPSSGSILLENMGADTQPIKTDTGALNAYNDGRLLKLQICAAVGIPEQYFGDISIGNLATAKTVELPMMKMFQSYQSVWGDAYQDIDEMVMEHAGISPDKWYVDRNFPIIAPEDALAVAQAIALLVTALPEFANSEDVKQQALIALGINDPGEVLAAIAQESKSDPSVQLIKALRGLKEVINDRRGNGNNSHVSDVLGERVH